MIEDTEYDYQSQSSNVAVSMEVEVANEIYNPYEDEIHQSQSNLQYDNSQD